MAINRSEDHDDASHGARVLIARLDERVNTVFRVLDEREKQAASAQREANRASDKAEDAQTKINIASNEWRMAMKDQQQTFATKGEIQALGDRVNNLEKSASSWLGSAGGLGAAKAAQAQTITLAIMAISLIVALVVAIWK